jgi:hypothetical protein
MSLLASVGSRFDIETKFWDRCEWQESGCLEWMGPRNARGYGRVSVKKNLRVFAHRLAYEIDKGHVPYPLCVLHICDNPPCVNVDHLVVGTKADNNRQAAERGRMQRGSRRYNAKLTEDLVREIKERYSAGGVSQRVLAREYGVSAMAINNAILGKRWRHVQ